MKDLSLACGVVLLILAWGQLSLAQSVITTSIKGDVTLQSKITSQISRAKGVGAKAVTVVNSVNRTHAGHVRQNVHVKTIVNDARSGSSCVEIARIGKSQCYKR